MMNVHDSYDVYAVDVEFLIFCHTCCSVDQHAHSSRLGLT
jgi:hypothetical protein